MRMLRLIALGLLTLLYSCEKVEDIDSGQFVSGINTTEVKGIISWEDIESAYTGSFRVPEGNDGVDNQNFHYSFGAFCMLDKGSILVEGHDFSKKVRQMSLPASLDGSEAALTSEWFDPTDNLSSTGYSDLEGYRLGDMLNVENRVYFTKYVWYNADGTDYDSFGYLEKGDSYSSGKTFGMWNADNELANNMRIGGYMCQAPAQLKSLGITFLSGQQGISGAAMGRWGPNLFAVKFDPTREIGEAMNAIPLVAYSGEDNAPENWWIANRIYSVVWIETQTKKGVLMLMTRGYGDTWYGEANDNNPPDPYGGYKEYHSTGKQLVAWVYNPDDLMKVYNEELQPHEISPVYEKVLIDLKPGYSKGEELVYSFFDEIRAIRMDFKNGRLIFLQRSYDDLPIGYVADF